MGLGEQKRHLLGPLFQGLVGIWDGKEQGDPLEVPAAWGLD